MSALVSVLCKFSVKKCQVRVQHGASMKLSPINNSSQLCRAIQASQYVSKQNRKESNESRKIRKKKHTHAMFIFNGFLLLEMPQRTWSACLDRTRGRKEDGRHEGGREGGGWKTTSYKHLWFVLILLFSSIKKEKKCFGHHLVVFPANPHNLLLSGGARGLYVCLHVHMCTCACVVALVSSVCGQNINPCQDSNPVWKHSS